MSVKTDQFPFRASRYPEAAQFKLASRLLDGTNTLTVVPAGGVTPMTPAPLPVVKLNVPLTDGIHT